MPLHIHHILVQTFSHTKRGLQHHWCIGDEFDFIDDCSRERDEGQHWDEDGIITTIGMNCSDAMKIWVRS